MTIERRLEVVKKLKKEFQIERILFSITNFISFMALMYCLGLFLLENNLNKQILVTMFGSSGLVTLSSLRILKMWDDSLRVVFGGRK